MCAPELKDVATTAAGREKILPEVAVREVSKLNASVQGDVVLTYDGVVYQVSKSWIERHPGGAQAILSCAGQDASVQIRTFHNPTTVKRILKMMKKVGKLPEDAKQQVAAQSAQAKRIQEMNADFQKIHELCEQNGWYKKNFFSSYAFDVLRTAFLFVCAVVCLVYSHEIAESTMWLSQKGAIVLGSMCLGLYFQHIAFFGHDTGHNAIMGNIKEDYWAGVFFGPLASGIGISWWKSTHNTHHIVPNVMEDDPNIQHVPMFCFDTAMADEWWSNYHNRPVAFNKIGKFLIRYQHWYYYPILAIARFTLYIQTIKHMVELCPLRQTAENNKKFRKGKDDQDIASWKPAIAWKPWLIEVAALACFWTWFGSLVYAAGSDAPLFMLVSTLTAGILHVQINLSHVIMDFCLDNPVSELTSEDYGFYEWQVLTTLDVDCPSFMHWFHGGLEYQLEHHLFPCVHRKNLDKLVPFVDSIMAKYNVPVIRLGFLEANWILVKHMAKIGAYVADKLDSNAVPPTKPGETTRAILSKHGARGVRWT